MRLRCRLNFTIEPVFESVAIRRPIMQARSFFSNVGNCMLIAKASQATPAAATQAKSLPLLCFCVVVATVETRDSLGQKNPSQENNGAFNNGWTNPSERNKERPYLRTKLRIPEYLSTVTTSHPTKQLGIKTKWSRRHIQQHGLSR